MTAAELEPELHAFKVCIDKLAPLSAADRAGVLLLLITRYAPHAFSDQQLMGLLRMACSERCEWCRQSRSVASWTHADGSRVLVCDSCMNRSETAHQYSRVGA